MNPVLLRLAREAELVERDDEDLLPGEDVGWLMIGRHASDKATAKAARRAAYKASTRRAARR